jgi:outer membrane lipoprotein SlyB
MNQMYDILAKLNSIGKTPLNEGYKGELAGGTAGGIAGTLAGNAVAPGIGGVVGGALGATAGGMAGRAAGDEIDETFQLKEIAPMIAIGARAAIPIIGKIAQALSRGASTAGKATVDAAGKAATGVGRGMVDVSKEVGNTAVRNAPAVGIGAGAYEIASQIADKMPDAVNRVYNDAGQASQAVISAVGDALDSATVASLATAAVKYAIPVGLLLAMLYGGKKLIDKALSEDNMMEENDMRDLLNKLDYVAEGLKGTAAGAGLGALVGGPLGAAVGALAGDKIGDEMDEDVKPDFPDIDRDGDRTEPISQAAKQQVKELAPLAAMALRGAASAAASSRLTDEASYSAKAARAGKDIGKPGKTFAKIAKSAGERYGSKERGEKVAGAVLAKLRAKEDVNEADMEESALQAYLGKKKYGEEGMKALQKAGRDGASKEKMARIRAQHDKMDEADMGEGNDFIKTRLDAIRAGKPTFKLDGKTYRVTGDTSDEKRMDEGFADFFDKKQMYKKIGADVEGRSDDYVVTFRDGTRKRYQEMDGRRRVTSLEPVDAPEEQDDDGNVVKRGRGRPKGSKRSLGAKGPSGKSKLLTREQDVSEDYDRDEYDEEGEMAKSQARTIEDAAQELQDILDDDQNLPEWVQKKITLAKEYIDTARDYMKANPDEEELVAEKAVSRAQRAAAGIAYAAKKGDIPKSELRGASKEMADMPEKELRKFAKTKEKGLPEKVKEEDKEEVDETTVSGSVATSTDTPKAKKGGMQFGKGVYEAAIAESFDRKLTMLTEGMNINMSVDETGKKSLTVSATDQEADQLAAILKMAGLGGGSSGSTCEVCGGHEGMHEAGCAGRDMVEEELANSPEPEYAELGDTRDYGVSGGLNGPKLQSNPNNPADNPLAMRSLASKGASGQLNLGAVAEDIEQKMQNRLMDLYRRIQ